MNTKEDNLDFLKDFDISEEVIYLLRENNVNLESSFQGSGKVELNFTCAYVTDYNFNYTVCLYDDIDESFDIQLCKQSRDILALGAPLSASVIKDFNNLIDYLKADSLTLDDIMIAGVDGFIIDNNNKDLYAIVIEPAQTSLDSSSKVKATDNVFIPFKYDIDNKSWLYDFSKTISYGNGISDIVDHCKQNNMLFVVDEETALNEYKAIYGVKPNNI